MGMYYIIGEVEDGCILREDSVLNTVGASPGRLLLPAVVQD
jgi:hypothetical protein